MAPARSIVRLLVASAVAGILAAPIAPLVAASVVASPAVDRPAGDVLTTRARRVSFEGTFQPAALLAPACDAAGRCAYPLARTGSEFTGAFSGSSIGAGAGTPAGTGFVGTGVHVFTGTVRGCGDGTLVWTEILRSADAVSSTGSWRVAAGAGTGSLADVVGGGTFVATQNPDGSGTSTVIGRIRC